MGILNRPLSGRLFDVAKTLGLANDPDRARKAISAAYARKGGPSDKLRSARSDYATYKQERKAEGKSF